MKKLTAIILVLVMVCSARTALAEEGTYSEYSKSLKAYAGAVLKELEKLYKASPETCGDEFIMLTHAYYEMYQTMSEVSTAEDQFELAQNPLSGGKSPMIEQAKEQEKLGLLLDKAMLERWEKWLNGEMDSTEYLELLMSMVGATTKAIDMSK